MSSRFASVTVIALSVFAPGAAHADAVPPAPKSCPPGQVGVTSHSGPACVPEAPKNCAPGYRGRIGGDCVLATCRGDDNCEAGEGCVLVDTCQEYRELHWTGWGWSAARPVSAGNLIAGPPRPAPPGPPKRAWVQLSICGQDGACAAPAECRASPLCYPNDQIGKTKAKVTEQGTPEPTSPKPDPPDPIPSATATGGTPTDLPKPPPDADVVVDPTGYTPPPDPETGGCRKGCTTASTPSDGTFLGVGLGLLALALIRRRRRSSNARG